MGGSLYSERRLSRAEYNAFATEVIFKLRRAGEQCHIIEPRTFSDKKDFGDLDLCLINPVIPESVISQNFNTNKVSTNTSVVSFGYKGFQCDLCHFPEEDLESAVNYMAFGDTSNMIGVLANYAMGLRYTHKGLVCPVKLKQEEPLGEIVISKDVEKIIGFMNLDYEPWRVGFKNEEEVFNWIIKSKYFSPLFFQFENLNHQNKTRNRKRAMYSRFVAWLNSREHDKISYIPSQNKSEFIWRAMLTFGNEWIDAAKPLIDKHRDDQKVRETFNGSDVSRITGLTGKDLGAILHAYKFERWDWNAFVLSQTREEIIEHFTKWWHEKRN